MNSLLAQLLLLYPDFEISHRDLQNVESGTLESVNQLFGKLVAQLPPAVFLFVVLDGISLYEDPARLDEMRMVIERLRDLATIDSGSGPVFKLLMTSPTRIRHLLKSVKKDDVLSVPRDVPGQSGLSVLRNGKVRQEVT